LYEQLYRAGFANQPQSKRADDGLVLKDALISAAVRCAPPDNKPLPEEIRNCLPYLERELALIRPRAILALGGIALNAYLDLLKREALIPSRAAYPFAHGASFRLPGDLPRLFAAYHPSDVCERPPEDPQIFGGVSGAGFSVWPLHLAWTKGHRLKPAPQVDQRCVSPGSEGAGIDCCANALRRAALGRSRSI
jgi:hypothetical protein